MKKLNAILISAGIILALNVYPEKLMAQTKDACVQAQMDAERDVNGTMWLAIGCIGGIIGFAIAYIVEPSPPAGRLLGKSPEYVASYTNCYKAAGKKIQQDKALLGCIIGTAISLGACCVWYIMWGAAAAASGY